MNEKSEPYRDKNVVKVDFSKSLRIDGESIPYVVMLSPEILKQRVCSIFSVKHSKVRKTNL